jgi:hypothetical protein
VETTELDLDAPGGELRAAMAYLAALAYPESHRKRNNSVKALLALMNRAARDLGKPLSPSASDLFAEVPRQMQARRLGTGRKGMLPRIRRRLQAAQAAAEAFGGRSLREIAAAHAGDAAYFLHTVWSESKPVLHLALAMRGTLMRWEDDGRPAYLQLLARPAWVREAMRSAESWRSMLSVGERAKPEFLHHIDADAFVRLVPPTPLRFDNHPL